MSYWMYCALIGVASIVLALGTGFWYTKKNPEKMRAWALKKQSELQAKGYLVAPVVAAGSQGSRSVNRFGVPIATPPKQSKKLSRKQTIAASRVSAAK